MQVKSFWKSRTLWLNVAATAMAIAQAIQGQAWFSPALQATVVSLLNILLRFLTSQPITQTAAVKLQAKMALNGK